LVKQKLRKINFAAKAKKSHGSNFSWKQNHIQHVFLTCPVLASKTITLKKIRPMFVTFQPFPCGLTLSTDKTLWPSYGDEKNSNLAKKDYFAQFPMILHFSELC
jgi:hypothetical protein